MMLDFEKNAFMKGFSKKLQNAGKIVKDYKEPLIGAGVGGALYGGIEATNTHERKKKDPLFQGSVVISARKKGIEPGSPEYKKFEEDQMDRSKKITRVLVPATGLVGGAMMGGLFRNARLMDAAFKDAHKHYRNAGGGHYGGFGGGAQGPASGMTQDNLFKAIGLSGKETTKEQAKKNFRDIALKHHPDRGGDPEMMKTVNDAWDRVKKSPWFQKLSHHYQMTSRYQD